MKLQNKLYILLILSLFFTPTIEAQFWKKLKKKAEDAVIKKADKKMDDVLNKKKKKTSNPDKQTKRTTNPSNENKKVKTTTNNSTSKKKNSPEELYRTFKFIPGEKVIFYDDLKYEEIGEFPSKWDLLRGGVEVAKLGEEKIILSTSDDYNRITPLFNTKNYLSDEFTIEFDVYVNDFSKSNHYDKYNISFRNESFYIGMSEIEIYIENTGISGRVREGNNTNFKFEEVPLGTTNTWHHISISYYKKKLKIYYDGYRISNLPNFKIPIEKFAIQLNTVGKKQKSAIKNIRIAHGGGQMYKRIIADGKYVTNGILFASGKSIIQPQSMGIINKIVSVMNEKPNWNFEIIGHTDSDGDNKTNLKLSKKRAEAVKNAIVEKGIKAERLSTNGKGENEPLNSNSNALEKANNRRVAFIKK